MIRPVIRGARRAVRRGLRMGLRAGLAFGAGFAGAVLADRQRSKAHTPAGGGAPRDAWKSSPLSSPIQASGGRGADPLTPAAPQQPLVEPTMLQAIVDRKAMPEPELEPDEAAPGEAEGTAEPDAAGESDEELADGEAEEPPPPSSAWVEPVDGVCPASHPLKAKAASLIYHLPGMGNYERVKPDRCYVDEPSAQADGFRKAQR